MTRRTDEPELRFRCNICGHIVTAPSASFGRENATCSHCRSSVRTRSVVRALSLGLFGESLAIDDFPSRKDLKGLGLSDWGPYAKRIAKKLDYQNTFFDGEPFLDICNPPEEREGTLDFLIATDVFEHVEPPAERAFVGARKLLKPSGFFVFSVPYTLKPDTQEHFPELHEWQIEDRGGKQILVNQTVDGRTQEFDDLVFHGGRGATLEMRVFSLASLQEITRKTGFTMKIHTGADLVHGVVPREEWSLMMTLRPDPHWSPE